MKKIEDITGLSAAKLKHWRTRRDMSQLDLANAVGAKASAIGRLEQGVHPNVRLAFAWKISRALGCRIDDLVEFSAVVL